MSYGTREVLKDISFEIKEGDIVGLLGVNGAGKSTLMNILTGYLKPSFGEIRICNIDMKKDPVHSKKQIGYLPELPPVYKDMKVKEYIKFVAQLKKVDHVKEETERVLQELELNDRKDEIIKKLSKGYQQRLGFAQAILGSPSVLILDEPLVGLDPSESKKMRDLILKLKKNHVILISSHILSEIEELCNEILVLKDGKIVLHNATTKAKRGNAKQEYLMTVKGEKEAILSILNQFDALTEIRHLNEKEKGIHEFVGNAKNNRDIRDSIFSYLVNKKLSVYEIKMVESSLEDVFMEITNKEDE